jgi:hypothetical protein
MSIVAGPDPETVEMMNRLSRRIRRNNVGVSCLDCRGTGANQLGKIKEARLPRCIVCSATGITAVPLTEFYDDRT